MTELTDGRIFGRDVRQQTRRLLWQYGDSMRRIAKLEKERNEFRQWADDARCTLRAQRITGMPRGGKTRDLSDVMVTVMARAEKYDDCVRRIDAQIDDIIRFKTAMDEIMATLPPVKEKLIAYRYIDGHDWAYISMRLNYSEDRLKHMDGELMDYFSEILKVSTI